MDYETEMDRRMKLSDAEFVRVLGNEDAAARAARAASATASHSSARSLIGVAQNRSVANGENERWLKEQITRHGKDWLKHAT